MFFLIKSIFAQLSPENTFIRKNLKNLSSGRSMIEVLGVLVIIGILSIVALFGFTYAMNQHKANETIHDVMLRATNVPMIDEYYTIREGDYEWKFAGLPEDGQLGTFYTMHTLVSDLNEYIYRVVVSDVQKRVCRRILSLNPTDIDAIYVEGDEPTDEECPNELNTMAFYFNEYGIGGHLPDPDEPGPDNPDPDNPDPDNPDPDNPDPDNPDPDNPDPDDDSDPDNPIDCTPPCTSCEECVDGVCQIKECQPCENGTVEIDMDECGCPICEEVPCDPPCEACTECVNGVCVPLCGSGEGCNVSTNTCINCPEINPTSITCPVEGDGAIFTPFVEGNGVMTTCCRTCSGDPWPNAYWDGEKAVCCYADTYEQTDGTYACCPTDTPRAFKNPDGTPICCPEGTVSVGPVRKSCGTTGCHISYGCMACPESDYVYTQSSGSGWNSWTATCNGSCPSGQYKIKPENDIHSYCFTCDGTAYVANDEVAMPSVCCASNGDKAVPITGAESNTYTCCKNGAKAFHGNFALEDRVEIEERTACCQNNPLTADVALCCGAEGEDAYEYTEYGNLYRVCCAALSPPSGLNNEQYVCCPAENPTLYITNEIWGETYYTCGPANCEVCPVVTEGMPRPCCIPGIEACTGSFCCDLTSNEVLYGEECYRRNYGDDWCDSHPEDCPDSNITCCCSGGYCSW